jgi:peptide/nickel transport system permease protein
VTFQGEAARRFRRNRVAVFSSLVILVFVVTALFAPILAPFSPLEQDLANNYAGPSLEHPLGTDDLGRDTLSRLIFGSRVSLGIAISSVALGVLVGTVLGLAAAQHGGWLDGAIMRVMDILLALPGILLGIAIVVVLGNGVVNTVIAVAIFSVPTFARLVRGSALSILERDYVVACRALGASSLRVIGQHVLPNTLTPIIVQGTLQLGVAIIIASGLSFLGLGVQPPNPEWGAMLSKGRELVRSTPVAAFAPGFAITIVVLSFSLLGDGLRDALDPKLKARA